MNCFLTFNQGFATLWENILSICVNILNVKVLPENLMHFEQSCYIVSSTF